MPRNNYSEILLHITWHTKNNQPVLTGDFEHRAHTYIAHRVAETPGAFLHEIGGTDDHIHIGVLVPPTLLIADWIGELKGSSTHHLNSNVSARPNFAWQTGYGVVSFGRRALDDVKEYIRNQRQRHKEGRVFAKLERTASEDAEASDEKPVETGSRR